MTTAEREPDRFHELDALRTFAILVVVLFHVGMVARGFADAADQPYRSGLRWLTSVAHDFQMPVFFVMSGFFGALVVARSGAAAFSRGRAVRIGIPLVVGWALLGPPLNALSVWGADLRGDDPPPIDPGVLFTQDLHHLWFLWYLLMFCAVVLGARALAIRMPALERRSRAWFRAVVGSPWRLVALVGVTAVALWPASLWTAEVPPEWTPHAEPFAYFLLFFGFGWLLFAERDLLPALRRAPVLLTAVALTAATLALVVTDNAPDDRASVEWDLAHAAAVLFTALATWTAIIALLGWFHRWFARPDARVRYAADAAYWLYLTHLPLVAATYYGLTDLGAPVIVKLVVVPAFTLTVLLALYAGVVRHTAIGRVLHGPR